MTYQPTWQTTVFILAFFFVYLAFLMYRTYRNRVDIYDFFLLTAVAILPTAFVVFPRMVNRLAALSGVAFPFLLLFGGLFVIVFLFLHRLAVKIKTHERMMIAVVQELALLDKEKAGPNPRGPA